MSAPAIGAKVLYCGHEGHFIADIFEIHGVNVVRANGPVSAKTIDRRNVYLDATHHIEDFPHPGFWRPDLGVFVVPCAQVTDLRPMVKAGVRAARRWMKKKGGAS